MVVRPPSPSSSCCYLELVEGLNGVYSIVLDRPRARNALSVQMVNELAGVLDRVAHDRL